MAQGKIDVEGLTYHGGGHLGVGGELGMVSLHDGTFPKPTLTWLLQMGDVYNSPSDPLFFLHHEALDWLWWKWESMSTFSAILPELSED